jgi:hypothetical protein
MLILLYRRLKALTESFARVRFASRSIHIPCWNEVLNAMHKQSQD